MLRICAQDSLGSVFKKCMNIEAKPPIGDRYQVIE